MVARYRMRHEIFHPKETQYETDSAAYRCGIDTGVYGFDGLVGREPNSALLTRPLPIARWIDK